MLVADTYLGNLTDDPNLESRVANADVLSVTLSDTERRRSRIRTTSENGTELGIVLSERLSDGDVLVADDWIVLVSLAPIDAMVFTIEDTTPSIQALALGHAIGNRHWDLAIKEDQAYLPVVEKRDRMEDLLEPLLPDRTVISYETVSPSTFDDSEEPDHRHSHGP